jgi:hypothetical protein
MSTYSSTALTPVLKGNSLNLSSCAGMAPIMTPAKLAVTGRNRKIR